MFIFGKEKNTFTENKLIEKKPFIELSRKKALLWLMGLFFICVWMFVLGILVGRDLSPVRFDLGNRDIREELKFAVEKEKEEQKNAVSHSGGQASLDGKQGLEFYEDLKSSKDSAGNMKMEKGALDEVPLKEPEPVKTEDKAVVEQVQTQGKTDPVNALPEKVSGQFFTVQISSGKDRKGAERRVKALVNKGYPAYVAESEIPQKGTWYRVRVGEYKDRKEADKILAKLGREKIKGIIVTKEK